MYNLNQIAEHLGITPDEVIAHFNDMYQHSRTIGFDETDLDKWGLMSIDPLLVDEHGLENLNDTYWSERADQAERAFRALSLSNRELAHLYEGLIDKGFSGKLAQNPSHR